MRILVTRPEPDNARTAAALRMRGHAPVLAPLLRIEPAAADIGAGPFAAALITSANAVRALAVHPARARVLALPALAVGEATAAAARDAGFVSVEAADGDAASLVRLVRVRPPHRSFIWPARIVPPILERRWHKKGERMVSP